MSNAERSEWWTARGWHVTTAKIYYRGQEKANWTPNTSVVFERCPAWHAARGQRLLSDGRVLPEGEW
jgi:hypothetical protein